MSSIKSNPEQSAEPPAKKRPRITSDKPDNSSHSDGGDYAMIHQSDDGKQSNVSTAKDHSKGEKVKHPAKADNDYVIGNDAAVSEGIIREGKNSILFWVNAKYLSDSDDTSDGYDSDDEEREEPNPTSDDFR